MKGSCAWGIGKEKGEGHSGVKVRSLGEEHNHGRKLCMGVQERGRGRDTLGFPSKERNCRLPVSLFVFAVLQGNKHSLLIQVNLPALKACVSVVVVSSACVCVC